MTDINFPESLDYIGTGAFMSCRALKSVTFPERMSDIGQYAFSNSGISDSIVLPNGLTEIPYRAFEYCPLTGIAIPEGVTTCTVHFLLLPLSSSEVICLCPAHRLYDFRATDIY